MQLTPGKMTIPNGTILTEQGQKLEAVVIILSGKIMVSYDCFHIIKEPATCIGLNEIEKIGHFYRCIAMEDSVIFVLPLAEADSVHTLIDKKDDYRAIFISSQYKSIAAFYAIYECLAEVAEKMYYLAPLSYRTYMIRNTEVNIDPIQISELQELKEYVPCNEIHPEQVLFYKEASKLPLDLHRSYYAKSVEMTDCQIQICEKIMTSLVEETEHLLKYIDWLMNILLVREGNNLYQCSLMLGIELQKRKLPMDGWKKYMLGAIEKLTRLENTLSSVCDKIVPIDLEQLAILVEDMAEKKMADDEGASEDEKDDSDAGDASVEDADEQKMIMQLHNSMQQIIDFSEHDKSDLTAFMAGMEYFVASSDRLSYDDEMKQHKKNVTLKFFVLYQECYFKRLRNENVPLAVKLFLHFGYMDERLLSKEQLLLLCRNVLEEKNPDIIAENEPDSNENEANLQNEQARIYTMCEWLDAIYTGKREPSKNEFDEEFSEYIKRLQNEGSIPQTANDPLKNMQWRVSFEIDNMFRVNSKICYGQISSYIPVLYQDVMYGYMEKMLLKNDAIHASIHKVEAADPSAFYRECLTSFLEIAVYHFPMPVKTYPDVILFPGYGLNGSMWQDISGKDKKSPGRFIVPVILGSELDDVIIKLVGRLRWELCRSVMGMQWNDIRTKSLTSEYIDHMQFYRENRDLSEEAREKVKRQIQKARNNSREFFLLDYENYIQKEYHGTMKINKAAREILSTYVPFPKVIREKLKQQRTYEIAFARFDRNRQKKEQELLSLIRNFQHKNKPVPDEVEKAYQYYVNL